MKALSKYSRIKEYKFGDLIHISLENGTKFCCGNQIAIEVYAAEQLQLYWHKSSFFVWLMKSD